MIRLVMIPRNHDLHGHHLAQVTPAHDVHEADYWADERLLLPIFAHTKRRCLCCYDRPTLGVAPCSPIASRGRSHTYVCRLDKRDNDNVQRKKNTHSMLAPEVAGTKSVLDEACERAR